MFIKLVSLAMGIKEAYYYLFYKLYKFAEWSPSIFPSDFVSALSIIFLEFSILTSLKIYYKFFHREDIMELLSYQTIIPLALVLLINNFMFLYKDEWKQYNKKFDKWSSDKNLKGTYIVVGIVTVIIINFIFSLYLIGEINGFY